MSARDTSPSSDVRYTFIDERVRVLRGDSARKALRVTNDARFYEEGYGVARVSMERWQLAQRAEMTHWLERGLTSADDGNLVHLAAFDAYRALSGSRATHAVELGCGPFTNLRLISRIARIDSCTLIDPSIMKYLEHPNCYYDARRLYVPPIAKWVPKLWRRAPRLLRTTCRCAGWTVPVRCLSATPGETFSLADPCDLFVMINVLEHCRDAHAVIEQVASAIASGGLLVVADVFFDELAVRNARYRCYDAAHPLRVTEAVLEPLLGEGDILYDRSEPHSVEGYPGTVKRCIISRVA